MYLYINYHFGPVMSMEIVEIKFKLICKAPLVSQMYSLLNLKVHSNDRIYKIIIKRSRIKNIEIY